MKKLLFAVTLLWTMVFLMGCDAPEKPALSSDTDTYQSQTVSQTITPTIEQTLSGVEGLPNQAAIDPLNSIIRNSGTPFQEGVSFIKESYEKVIAVDITGKTLFELETDNFDGFTPEGFCNGISLCGNKIIDKSGNVIASPDKNGYDYLIPYNVNGNVLAIKTTKQFSGNTYEFGVINNSGEWKSELSDDYLIMRLLKNRDADDVDDFFRKLLLDLEQYYELRRSELDRIYLNKDNILVIKIREGTQYKSYSFDIVNDTYVSYTIHKGSYYDTYSWDRYRYFLGDDRYDIILEDTDLALCLYDDNYYVMLHKNDTETRLFDLSEHPVNHNDRPPLDVDMCGENLVIVLPNQHGERYFCYFDSTGLLFEPIPYDRNTKIHDVLSDGFILSERGKYIYYSKIGESKDLPYRIIEEFSEGLAWAQKEANSGWIVINTNFEVVFEKYKE